MSTTYHPSVHFSEERYEALRETYRKWWAGELDRPIVPIVTYNHPSHREPSPYPDLSFTTAWDFSVTEEQLIDAMDYRLSTQRFHGDAYPTIRMDPFGAGVVAAFLGCDPVSRPETVWFAPPREDIPIEELHFEFDENNRYWRRVKRVYELATEKWQGQVVMGMVDLGGVLDILASFRGSENLLMDLYDSPEEVKRCIDELKELWFVYFNKINEIIAPCTRGYSQWFHLYGEKPSYILQSDFSYMISPEMFDEFVAPELAWSASRLDHTLYHMDGIGEIPHLNTLLSIKDIRGIQWVPGAGTPEEMDWDELGAKILDAGVKLLSCNQNPDGSVKEAFRDRPGQLYFWDRGFSLDRIEDARAYGALYGIDVTL